MSDERKLKRILINKDISFYYQEYISFEYKWIGIYNSYSGYAVIRHQGHPDATFYCR